MSVDKQYFIANYVEAHINSRLIDTATDKEIFIGSLVSEAIGHIGGNHDDLYKSVLESKSKGLIDFDNAIKTLGLEVYKTTRKYHSDFICSELESEAMEEFEKLTEE